MFFKRLLFVSTLFCATHAAHAQELTLAINEGVSYKDSGLVSERYQPLIALLEKQLKRPVKVQKIEKYSEFEKGLAEQKFDLAFIHPPHVALRSVKNGKYDGLASAKDFTEYRNAILVKKDAPYQSVQDLRGKKIGAPSKESITTVVAINYLRENGFAEPEKSLSLTNYQDAIAFMIDNQFVDAGMTASPAEIKAWQAKGGRVLAQTKPIPIKLFLASKRLPESERSKVQSLMLSLAESDQGKVALAKIGMKGFVPWNEAAMDDASKRLGL